MSDCFSVRAGRGDYEVRFVSDFAPALLDELQESDVLIVDENITRLYAAQLAPALTRSRHIAVKPTESLKSYQGVEPIILDLISRGFRKNNRLFAVGGGITQDVTAFIASILFRGVNWFFVPTTLLAQCDSCIGSKTSINFGEYKNQIGGFYPPSRIFIDLNLLSTLPRMDLQSGMGEMAHYFLVSGPDDYDRFKSLCSSAMDDLEILKVLVARSLAIKKAMVEIDEFDQGPRNVFNYGHTFGHAIESITDYAIPHGIAVAYGMDIANYISAKKGLIDHELRNDILGVLKTIWSGTRLAGIDVARYRQILLMDKKVVGNELHCILTRGLGAMFKSPLALDNETLGWMKACFDDYA